MELRDFIKETISQISKGISDSGKSVEGTNINPQCCNTDGLVPLNPIGSASLLKFKIELCQNEENGKKSGIGVFFCQYWNWI